MTTDLHNKYRPSTFDEVIGHKAVVDSLKSALNSGLTHSFIFAGPSGIGKTTLARIIGKQLGCDAFNVKEIDAAAHTGIDAMREVTESMRYSSMGSNPNRVVVVDECHALSKAAWQSLLKSVEEPPPNAFWIFLTTELDRIPETIKTRCQVYGLKPISDDDLFDLLAKIADTEEYPCPDEVIDLCVRRAKGSPRRALVALGKVTLCEDRKEALILLDEIADDSPDLRAFTSMIYKKGFSWKKGMAALTKLKGMHPETIRMSVVEYYSASLLGAATDGQSEGSILQSLKIMEAFGEPYKVSSTSKSLYPVQLSLGEYLYSEGVE